MRGRYRPVYIPGATHNSGTHPSPAHPPPPTPFSSRATSLSGPVVVRHEYIDRFSIVCDAISIANPTACIDLKYARYEISIVIRMKCRSDKRSKEERYTSHHFDHDKLSNLCILYISKILIVRDVVIFSAIVIILFAKIISGEKIFLLSNLVIVVMKI